MKEMKKWIAVLLVAVMTLSFLPMVATAAEDAPEETVEPTCLYVGEQDKSGDNLIDMYKEVNEEIRVVSVHDSASYYTVTTAKEEAVDAPTKYVLTFYNGYTNSELVKAGGINAVVYCDGDLTIRINDRAFLDVKGKFKNEKGDPENAYGIYVAGTLHIEGVYLGEGGAVRPGELNVNGTLTKPESDRSVKGHVGIYAKSVLVYGNTVKANGGHAGIMADEVFGMIDAEIICNRAAGMTKGTGSRKEYLFDYAIDTFHYIQAGGSTSAAGFSKIERYYGPLKDNDPDWQDINNFDERLVVYQSVFKFDKDYYDLKWLDKANLFYNRDYMPSCLWVYYNHGGSYCVKLSESANEISAQARGSANLYLVFRCGSKGRYLVSKSFVSVTLKWWQWPLYFFSFIWARIRIALLTGRPRSLVGSYNDITFTNDVILWLKAII